VAIATGVVRDAQRAARIAFVDVAAQRRRATLFDRAHHRPLLARRMTALPILLTVLPEDVGDFQCGLGGTENGRRRVHFGQSATVLSAVRSTKSLTKRFVQRPASAARWSAALFAARKRVGCTRGWARACLRHLD